MIQIKLQQIFWLFLIKVSYLLFNLLILVQTEDNLKNRLYFLFLIFFDYNGFFRVILLNFTLRLGFRCLFRWVNPFKLRHFIFILIHMFLRQFNKFKEYVDVIDITSPKWLDWHILE